MRLFSRIVSLPQTLDQFDALVNLVCAKYHFEDKTHAAVIVSVAIRHLPNEQSHSSLDYFGSCIAKSIANGVANHKGETLRHEAQVTHLQNLLSTDPNNQQARDELTKAASQGSLAAKAALEKIDAAGPQLNNVIPLK